MKTEEVYAIYVDREWKEDVDTEEEVKEKFDEWINHKDYIEDELLDTTFEAVVSTIIVKLIVK